MPPNDFKRELLLVLNYGDAAALRRLVAMRFPDQAAPFAAMPDDAVEEAFHLVRRSADGVRAELAQESQAWLAERGR